MLELNELIAESNVVNFLIVLVILLVVYFLFIRKGIISSHNDLIKSIEKSNTDKEQSYFKLENTKKDFAHTDDEILDILNNAKEIITKTEAQLNEDIDNIKDNFSLQARKIIENQIKNINNKTRNEISETAILKAESKLKEILVDENMHHKFINQAIDEIDEANI